MEVICIFELFDTNGKLFAAQFEGEEEDEAGHPQHAFSKLTAEWSDSSWFRAFFSKFKQDYFNFYGSSNINRLVLEAIDFADNLFEDLTKYSKSDELDKIFKPLNNSDKDQTYERQSLKAKGSEVKSYLRIYAVRYGDEFVITGGTVKLTHWMKDRDHTRLEKHKLDTVVKFLSRNGIEGKIVYLDK